MNASKTVILVGVEATEELGEQLGQQLHDGQVVGLRGELGAGKTCLARGLARGLGIDEPDEVCSPTYLLVMEHPGPIPLVHIDAYLPAKTRGFLEDGGLAYLAEIRGVVVVEWADRLADMLPEAILWVDLAPCVESGAPARRATLRGPADRFGWIAALPDRIARGGSEDVT